MLIHLALLPSTPKNSQFRKNYKTLPKASKSTKKDDRRCMHDCNTKKVPGLRPLVPRQGLRSRPKAKGKLRNRVRAESKSPIRWCITRHTSASVDFPGPSFSLIFRQLHVVERTQSSPPVWVGRSTFSRMRYCFRRIRTGDNDRNGLEPCSDNPENIYYQLLLFTRRGYELLGNSWNSSTKARSTTSHQNKSAKISIVQRLWSVL